MESIWQAQTKLRRRDKLTRTVKTDCAVIGAGMAGLLIANELTERGFSVVIAEARTVCSGATARTTAKITSQHGLCYDKLVSKLGTEAAAMYYRSNTEAIDYYEKLVARYGIDCSFERLPFFVYSQQCCRKIVGELTAVQRIGAQYEYTSRTDLPYPVKAALKFPRQATFNPLRFASAIADRLEIYENSPVTRVTDGVVTTDKGKIEAHYIVDASHYPVMSVPGFYFLRQHQQRSYAIAIKSDKKLNGMYCGIDDDRTLRPYKDYIIIAGEKHRTGKNCDGGRQYRLPLFAREAYPGSRLYYSWSNQDCMTHDSVPFIGRFSRFMPRVFVATGFNLWGMSTSAVAAQLVADMVCGRENEYSKLYLPQRINLRAGAKSLAVDVGHAVTGLCAGVFSGKSRRCTHLGCRLVENGDENTLECPCHGSQFAKDGSVQFSPAKKELGH